MASVKDAIGSFSWNKSSKNTVDPNVTTGDAATKTNRTITMTHFSHALSEVVPSFSEDASDELYRWHDMFSTNGNPAMRGSNGGQDGKTNEKAQLETKGSGAHSEMASFLDMMTQLRK